MQCSKPSKGRFAYIKWYRMQVYLPHGDIGIRGEPGSSPCEVDNLCFVHSTNVGGRWLQTGHIHTHTRAHVAGYHQGNCWYCCGLGMDNVVKCIPNSRDEEFIGCTEYICGVTQDSTHSLLSNWSSVTKKIYSYTYYITILYAGECIRLHFGMSSTYYCEANPYYLHCCNSPHHSSRSATVHQQVE